MRETWKKWAAIVLVSVTVFSLAAYAITKKDTDKQRTEENGDLENEDDNKLVLWSVATESDSYHNAYNKAIEDYKTAHPEVTFEHKTYEKEEYKLKINTAMVSGDLPDIFYTLGGDFSASFVESGNVLELNPYYTEEYQKQISEAALGNVTYNNILYGLTYTTPISALFYNKTMFEQYNLKVPGTWKELVNVCEAFLANNITPFSVSAKESWVLAIFHDALTLKSAGPEKTLNTITKKGGSYRDPDFLNSAKKLKKLIKMGAFPINAPSASNYETCDRFLKGKVPMFVYGSGLSNLMLSSAENPEDFGVVPFPVLNNKKAKSTDIMGGTVDALMVSGSTKDPELAGNAVIELCKGISKYSYLDGAGIAAWEIDYDDSEVNPIIKQLTQYAFEATSLTLWFDTVMEAENTRNYLELLQQFYVEDLSPEDFVEKMAKQLEN